MNRRSNIATTQPAEEGTILIWALFIVVLTSGMVVSHATFLKASKRMKTVRHVHDNLGNEFAKSGATEALNWFRRRSLKPITVFDPVLDPDAKPPRLETIDPTIGLVREFEIQGSLWGRYEIRHEEAKEISAECGAGLPAGSVWEIGVRSYIYRVVDKSVPFNEKPNRLMSSNTLKTQFRYPQVNPPAAAALCADQPAMVNLGPMARIDGTTGAAIAYRDPTTMDVVPTDTDTKIDAIAEVKGAQLELAVGTYDADPMNVVSMRIDDLRSFADYVMLRDSSMLPLVDGKFDVKNSIILKPKDWYKTEAFDMENVLLYVGGNLKLRNEMTKLSTFSGILYVEGNAYIDANLDFSGVLVVRGELHVGKGTNPVNIRYDPIAVERLRLRINKYRTRRGKESPPVMGGPKGQGDQGDQGDQGGKGGKGK